MVQNDNDTLRNYFTAFYLGGDLMLVKVGEVLEFGKDIFSSGKGLWFTLFPFLSFLAPCRLEWRNGEAGLVGFAQKETP